MKSSNEYDSEARYQIWRSGWNPDRLSYDRSYRDWSDGMEPEYTARYVVRQQSEEREHRRYMQDIEEQEYYRQQEQEYNTQLQQSYEDWQNSQPRNPIEDNDLPF